MTAKALLVIKRVAPFFVASLCISAFGVGGVVVLAQALASHRHAHRKSRTCVRRDKHARGRKIAHRCRAVTRQRTARKHASTRRPKIMMQSLVTSSADGNSSDGGNGWGPHKLRIVRSSNGKLFSVYPSGPDTVNKTYSLMESTNGGSSWSRINDGLTINGSVDDGGRETPLLLISPSDVVYLIGWAGGVPTLVNEGVNGAGPYSATPIPGSWQAGDNWPYAGAAIDSSGNLYVQENTASSTGGTSEDSGYLANLAWTTGGTGNFTWHFARLPAVPGADYRSAYSFELPDNKGGLDVVATNDVSCANTSFTGNTSISNPAYTTQSTSSYGFIQDRVYDWHTANLNASGGPAWTIARVSQNTRATGGSDCASSGIVQNDYAQDAYRDTYGNVHVMYAFKPGYVGHHAVLGDSGGTWKTLKDVTLPSGYCANEARVTQDSTGRFYVISHCGNNSLYVWPADTIDGTTVGSLSTLTLTNAITGWDYFAAPSGGTPTNRNYLDMVDPTNSATGLAYARIQFAKAKR
jgi:hypothetical protein